MGQERQQPEGHENKTRGQCNFLGKAAKTCGLEIAVGGVGAAVVV